VTTEDIKEVIIDGEIIEEYLEDFPCPSILILGFVRGKSLHIVIGECDDHVRIVTVYEPDETQWIQFRKRKE